MKKERKSIKEIVEKALEKVELKRRQRMEKDEVEVNCDDEVLVEPIVWLDPEVSNLPKIEFEDMFDYIGEIHDFTNLSDITNLDDYNEDEPTVEVNEDDEQSEDDDFATNLKKIADSITALTDETMLECTVEGEERILVSGTNCNMKQVPLLEKTFITPVNLVITEIQLNGDMENFKEAELMMICSTNEYEIEFRSDVNTLMKVGLILVLEDDYLDIVEKVAFSSVAWRGLTKTVDIEELEKMFKQTI